MDAEKMMPESGRPEPGPSATATPESGTAGKTARENLGPGSSIFSGGHTGEIRMGRAKTAGSADGARPADGAAPAKARPETGRTATRTSGERVAQRRRTRSAERPPRAAELGFPAVLEHELVAVTVTASRTPVTVHRWADGRVRPDPMLPLHAVVWARAGRVTLAGADDLVHRLTLLAEDEYGEHRIGEHWPLGEPAGRARRVAAATLRDLGDVLTFPVWLARTSHISARRNLITKRFLRELVAVSPDTVVQHNQTFGTPPDRPGQVRPYDHRGLVGHEGYPKEL